MALFMPGDPGSRGPISSHKVRRLGSSEDERVMALRMRSETLSEARF